MKAQEMFTGKTENMNDPHEIAQEFESEIKKAVAEKFSLNPEEVSLLLEDKEGVYLSKKEENTLCCLAVNKENGYMFLVTAKIEEDGKKLSDYKCDVIS